MGYSATTVCKTCRIAAPLLADGEGVFTGFCSLSSDRVTLEAGRQNFGYLYSGFESLGMITLDLYTFKGFLVRHDGHEVITLPDDGADQIVALGAEEEEWTDDLPEGWVVAYLEIACRTCKKRRRSRSTDNFEVREQRAVDPAQARCFIERIVPVLPDNLYRCVPCGRRDLVSCNRSSCVS